MMRFRISPDGGDTYEIEAGSRDVLMWERTDRKGRSFRELAEAITMADAYRLAWIAVRRQRPDTGDLASFEESTDVDMIPSPKSEGDDDGENPTRAGH